MLVDAYCDRYIKSHLFPKRFLCHFSFEANHICIDALITSKLKEAGVVPLCAHTGLGYASVMHVLAILQDCVCGIDFSYCGLGDKQVAVLAALLAGKHRKLRVLEVDLSGNKLSDQCVANFFDTAASVFGESLQYVSVGGGGNMIGPNAINSITTVLARSLSVITAPIVLFTSKTVYISRLDISNNPLGVDGLRALRGALCATKLANLEDLSLAGSLTDDADINTRLIHLISGHCQSLKQLDLSRNNLGTHGINALGKVLSHLNCMTSLYLEDTKLGDEGIAALIHNL